MKLDTKAILARANAATEGPWRVGNVETWHVFGDPNGDVMARGLGRVVLRANENFPHANDMAFIAAARTDVPALCAEVERLRAVLGDFVEYERRRHPPRMGGDEYPPSLKPLMLAARALLEGE